MKNEERKRRRRIKSRKKKSRKKRLIEMVMSSVGVIFVVLVGVMISSSSDDVSLIVAKKGTKCPDSFGSKPILYSKEAARMCLNITEEFLQRVEYRIELDISRSVKARELLHGKTVFSPRHEKHEVHLNDSYDIRLPQQYQPPNRAMVINMTIGDILYSTKNRVVQAALPVEDFPVQFETFESSRENCDTSPDLSAPVLWISSPRGISSTHYDRSMNAVVGINGTKRWSLWHPREVEKMGIAPWLSLRYQQIQHRNERVENSIDLTLSRGEVLYVPPFWAHRVRSSETDVVVALSVLYPSHVEERYSNAYFQIQIFLERWNRKEKLAAVYTFLDILIETLKLDDRFQNGDDFISNIVSQRYLGYKPFSRDNVLLETKCERSSRLHEKNTIAHFRDTARDFATRMWGARKGLCGGHVPLESSVIWLNVANLVEELILFAVDNNVDDLVTVFTECYSSTSKI